MAGGDNITPLRPVGSTKDRTAAERARRFRRKKRKGTVTRRVTPPVTVPVMPPSTPTVTPAAPKTVTPSVTDRYAVTEENISQAQTVTPFAVGPPHTSTVTAPVTPFRRTSRPLVAIAYGFFGLGVGINIWNACTGGTLTDVALPATLGVLAEGVVFFLPAWALTLPVGRQMLAWMLFVFVSVFALTNSLRMASIVAADQATTRADRQTEGVQTADRALETARTKRDEACGRGLGKTVACQARQAEVAKLESRQTQATAKVTAQAKPVAGDFAT
jgi:hypothetical protein